RGASSPRWPLPPAPPPTFLIPERSRPAARPARTCRTACRALERHLEPGGKHPVRRLEPRLREVVEPDGVAQLHRETPGQRGHDRGFAVDPQVLGVLQV